jgi:hypothetical protein
LIAFLSVSKGRTGEDNHTSFEKGIRDAVVTFPFEITALEARKPNHKKGNEQKSMN